MVEYFNLDHSGFIYLKTDPKISLDRINKRLRKGENAIPLDYLESLHTRHNNWLENESNVLTIDVSNNFKNDTSMIQHTNEIIKQFNL